MDIDKAFDRDPWKDEEDVILLKEYLRNRNKWSEIARSLSGRSENAVKNRFNILLKKYKQEDAAGRVTELDKALLSIASVPTRDDLHWVQKVIELKEPHVPVPHNGVHTTGGVAETAGIRVTDTATRPPEEAKISHEMEEVRDRTERMSLEEQKTKAVQKLRVALADEAMKSIVSLNDGEYSCPNKLMIERMKNKELGEVRRKGTRFVNPETQQEVYLTSDAGGVYITDLNGRGTDLLPTWARIGEVQ